MRPVYDVVGLDDSGRAVLVVGTYATREQADEVARDEREWGAVTSEHPEPLRVVVVRRVLLS